MSSISPPSPPLPSPHLTSPHLPHLISSPSHPISSHPSPFPSHPISSYLISANPIPSHPIPSQLISSRLIIEVGRTESGMTHELRPLTSRLGVNISTQRDTRKFFFFSIGYLTTFDIGFLGMQSINGLFSPATCFSEVSEDGCGIFSDNLRYIRLHPFSFCPFHRQPCQHARMCT